MTRFTVCLMATAVLSGSLRATPAAGYNLLTKSGACPSGFVFSGGAGLDVNISTAPKGVAQYLIGAVATVAERIGQVGGQNFDYTTLDVVFDALAVGDSDGRNDVGLADLTASGAGAMGPAIVDLATCETIEANVLINKDSSWEYFDPGDHGDDYYNAASVSGGKRYLQPVLMHEFGHNLSLAHSTDSYTFMNSGTSTTTGRPWSNRRDDKRIEPLPDERRALRKLYGNSATETDVAALVTWFDDTTGVSPAPQRLLCNPSAGVDFAPGLFDPSCGVDSTGAPGARDVCIGKDVFTRVAIPNYGTSAMAVTVQLWLSANDGLDRTSGADVMSPTIKTLTIAPASTARRGFRFELPPGLTPGIEYYPIVFIDSGAFFNVEESQQNNWIPLRRSITAQACP